MAQFQATVTSKGQITIPIELRSALGLKPGDKLVFTSDASGTIRIEARTASLGDLVGSVREGPSGVTGDRIAGWIEDAGGTRWRERSR